MASIYLEASRAIISVWKQSHSHLTDDIVWPILQKLNSVFPSYYLPDASVSSTQHYLPLNSKNKTTLIVNAFVVIGQNPIYIIWNDIELTDEETKILDDILKSMNYFGRAESWCNISIVDHGVPAPNCLPLVGDIDSTKDEIVNILLPKKTAIFTDLSKNNISPKEHLNSITVTTKQLHDQNYKDPPGGQWISYAKPLTDINKKTSSKANDPPKNLSWIRYAIVGSVRPSIKNTLRIGDIARTACMSIYGKKHNGGVSETFSGKDFHGKPLKGHKHAFYLPTYELQNKELDHLTILAKNAFTQNELDVLFHLNKLYKYNVCDIDLVFQDCGSIDNLPDIPILRKSKIWRSATPLILSRHIKYRRRSTDNPIIIDGPKEQISKELRNRYMLDHKIKSIDIFDQKHITGTNVQPFDFYIYRSHGSIGSNKTYTARLEFTEPVQGPITLGYGSHFGLGLFLPEDVNQ